MLLGLLGKSRKRADYCRKKSRARRPLTKVSTVSLKGPKTCQFLSLRARQGCCRGCCCRCCCCLCCCSSGIADVVVVVWKNGGAAIDDRSSSRKTETDPASHCKFLFLSLLSVSRTQSEVRRSDRCFFLRSRVRWSKGSTKLGRRRSWPDPFSAE